MRIRFQILVRHYKHVSFRAYENFERNNQRFKELSCLHMNCRNAKKFYTKRKADANPEAEPEKPVKAPKKAKAKAGAK